MREQNQLLRIDRISLENFRCFETCELNLHPKLTILVAENAQGKTGLLDAVSLALDVFVQSMINGRVSGGFKATDIRQTFGQDNRMTPHVPVAFKADGMCDGHELSWSRSLSRASARSRTSLKGTAKFREIVLAMRQRVDFPEQTTDERTILPAVAYYRIDRIQIDQHQRLRSWPARQELGRRVAYLDCLSPSASYHAFVKWFEKRWMLLQSAVSKFAPEYDRPEDQLTIVRSAVAAVLQPTGWTDLTWEMPLGGTSDFVEQGFLAAVHPQSGRLPLKSLSDGVRNMVALVADLAHRCVRLNPHLGEDAAKNTPGILLIDEVDMHLHPRWQQLIVELLQTAFPAMQLILTTHSPHVLSTVDADSIRVLHLDRGHGETRKPTTQTLGDGSAEVLAGVMDVNPIPDVESARLLSRYRVLVQNSRDQGNEAREAWGKLLEHFGVEHHLLQEAAILRRLQEFKREHHILQDGEN
jgi:predicted ATP-binding protein involved in virulence